MTPGAGPVATHGLLPQRPFGIQPRRPLDHRHVAEAAGAQLLGEVESPEPLRETCEARRKTQVAAEKVVAVGRAGRVGVPAVEVPGVAGGHGGRASHAWVGSEA
jgi:hypothetical protein